jgi:hypothetical protein
MEAQIIQVITVAGAAGAFFLVLKWIVDGKLHSDSETAGLRQDKADLLKINADQSEALKRSNELLATTQDRLAELAGSRHREPAQQQSDSSRRRSEM